jgi:hypothetical protein
MNYTNIDIPSLESKVDKKMIKLCKQSKFLEKSKITPIHPQYTYSNVGLMLFVGKMGSGKTNDVLKHLLMTDILGENNKPFYNKIVYSGSVGEDDETYTTFKKALKTPIINIPPNNFMEFLKEHIRVKKNITQFISMSCMFSKILIKQCKEYWIRIN